MKMTDRTPKVEILTLDEDNVNQQDIVCVRGEKNIEGITRKKNWLKARLGEGLKFKVLKVNGRSWGFIEYLPAERAWRPVMAPGYMFIDCLWIIGRYKGQGFGKRLLAECEKDSRGLWGLVTVTSPKPFTAKRDFFLKNGFKVCDTARPHFELLAKVFRRDAPLPKFTARAKTGEDARTKGLVIHVSDQCPYMAQSLKEMVEVARRLRIPCEVVRMAAAAEAQDSACAYGVFSIFRDGRFLTHEPFYGKKFESLLQKPAARKSR